MKDTLATQDKSQRESLANLEKILATQDKNLKDTLAIQDKIWNIRFENFVSAIEKKKSK